MEITILKLLLENFIDEVKLTSIQLGQVKQLIFDEIKNTELIQDENLLDTIDYLKEIAEENGFVSIQQLSDHFKLQKKEYAKFLWEVMDETDSPKSPSVTHITTKGLFVSGSFYKNVHTYPSFHLENFDQVLRAFLERFSAYCKEVIGRTLRNNLTQMVELDSDLYPTYCKRSLFIDNISNGLDFFRYFEEFADADNNGELFVWHSLSGEHPIHLGRIQYFRESSHRDCLESNHNKKKYRSAKNEVTQLYSHILDQVQRREPIDDHAVKEDLLEWLCYSKFHRSESVGFRRLEEMNNSVTRSVFTYTGEQFSSTRKRALIKKKQEYKTLLLSKQWKILKSPDGHDWLTSDNPGFAIHLTDLFDQSIPIPADPSFDQIKEDTVVYFPLSSEYCLRIQPPFKNSNLGDNSIETAIEFEQSSNLELEVVNGFTFSTKNEIVIAKNKKTIEHLACV